MERGAVMVSEPVIGGTRRLLASKSEAGRKRVSKKARNEGSLRKRAIIDLTENKAAR